MTDNQPIEFSGQTQVSGIPMGALVGFSIEDILIRRGHLTEDKLQQAQLLSEEREESLEDVLLAMKFITEEQLLLARSEQLDISCGAPIDVKEISDELLSKISISFAKQSMILPLSLEDGCVTIACVDPYDIETFDQLSMLLQAEPIPLLYSQAELLQAINQVYDRLHTAFGFDNAKEDLEDVGKEKDEYSDIGEAVDDLLEADDDAPVIKLVNALIYRAMKEGASDIHFEPFEKEVVIRFRIDGVLREVTTAPKRANSHITARIKIMSKLDIAEKRLPQDGKIRLKIAGQDLDIRVSTIPTSYGERAVLRLLDKSNVLLDLEKIGFGKENLEKFNKLITRSHGIILVTGPTGSGKTTTLYSALSRINSPDKNILTVEDPVEYQLKGIGQMQVNSKINLTFSSGLRAFLRQDPDVILVGETRDAETAEIAIQASLTGHLVFTTLHTNDSATAFTRLIDMDVEPFLVASSVVGVLAQRLVRRVCSHCKVAYTPLISELEQIGVGASQWPPNQQIYRANPDGCEECKFSGYKGRTGIYELLIVNDEIRSMVMRNEPSGKIKQKACEQGMLSLREDGAQKILRGETTIEEVSRVTSEDKE